MSSEWGVTDSPYLKDTPLSGAVRNSHTNIVRLLLENGADVNEGRGGYVRRINCICYKELSQMSTKDGYVRRINCKCYKELSQSLRVRVYISFKFVAECRRLKSRFNHISLGWSLNKEK